VSSVFVVVAKRYNGHELWTALGIIQKAGHTFEVVSTQTEIEDERDGRPNTIQRTLDDVLPIDVCYNFDGFMIVSGNMKDTEAYWTDSRVLDIIEGFNRLGKPVAAICCSVPTIRLIARGKRVSYYPLVRSRLLLREAGAILTGVTCSVDGQLVTAEHQMATEIWAKALVALLEGRDPEVSFNVSNFTPGGRERKPIPAIEAIKRAQSL
jgi:putative intracellular protease/amidase